MPAWQQPDPAKVIADLMGREAETERAVRRGKPAPKVRELYDVDKELTAKVTNGQTLVYDDTIGRWRPGSAAAGSRIAIFNNPSSTLVDTNYHEFTQGWSSGDTSWFTWPAPGYGGDQSRVGLNETGIYTVTAVLFFSAAGGYGRVVEEVSGAIVAPSSGDGISGHDDVSMAGALILETVEDFPVVRLFTSPTNVVSGRLSIQYHGDFEYVTP
jgi:hypothetical protein